MTFSVHRHRRFATGNGRNRWRRPSCPARTSVSAPGRRRGRGEVFATHGDGIAAAFPSARRRSRRRSRAADAADGLRVRMGIILLRWNASRRLLWSPSTVLAGIMAVGHAETWSLRRVRGARAHWPQSVELRRSRTDCCAEPDAAADAAGGRLLPAAVLRCVVDTRDLPLQRSSLIGRNRDVAGDFELVAASYRHPHRRGGWARPDWLCRCAIC